MLFNDCQEQSKHTTQKRIIECVMGMGFVKQPKHIFRMTDWIFQLMRKCSFMLSSYERRWRWLWRKKSNLQWRFFSLIFIKYKKNEIQCKDLHKLAVCNLSARISIIAYRDDMMWCDVSRETDSKHSE
jgi:hypothetical protein